MREPPNDEESPKLEHVELERIAVKLWRQMPGCAEPKCYACRRQIGDARRLVKQAYDLGREDEAESFSGRESYAPPDDYPGM